ncbi:S1C family serine protease [Nannocystaceae bacterium ST9]
MSEPRVAYPFWVAMGAAFTGTLLGGAAVWIGVSERLDAIQAQTVAGASVEPPPVAAEPEHIEMPEPDPVADRASEAITVGQEFLDPGDTPLVRAIAQTRDSVVSLAVAGEVNGAGVVYEDEGLVLTNYHVIEPILRARPVFGADAERAIVRARFADGRERNAEVVAADADEDIAVLRLVRESPSERFTVAPIGRSAALRLGEQAFAIGAPVGLESTIAVGIVSSLGRTGILANRQQPVIQLDASINFGASGGPLFNLRGELVGITTARSSRGEGIGFAIPIDRVWVFLKALDDGTPLRAGMIGVELDLQAEITDRIARFGYHSGVAVGRVLPDAPAAKAGLAVGDVIVEIRGRRYDDLDAGREGRALFGREFQQTVRSLLPSETLAIEVVRGRELLDIELTVEATSPEGQARIDTEALLGIMLAEGRRKPTVASLLGTGALGRQRGAAQMLEGATIVEVFGEPVTSVEQLGERLAALSNAPSGGARRSISVVFETKTGERLLANIPLAVRR